MIGVFEGVVQDLRFTCRMWLRSPGFAIAAIATLGLGIGANTALFSVVSGVLLRPLAFADPERLVQLNEKHLGDLFDMGPNGPVVYRDFEEWRTHSKLFEGMVTYLNSSRNLQDVPDPEQVATVAAERGLFNLLGVPALAGRTFSEDDPLDVAVVSSGFWRRHFGGEWSAIGRRITLDGRPFTLIGVMPEGFNFPYRSPSTELWVPWDAPADLRTRPNGRLDAVLARLKPGVVLEAARQELTAMAGPTEGGREAQVRPLKEVVSGSARESLLVLLGAVGMVLLVACVNVANLLLARTAARGREIAIRAALGVGRLRLIRQFLTESLMLALAGGFAGLALGTWGNRVLVKTASEQIPRAWEIGLDWRVFAFLLAACVTTGIGFGLAPAIAAARGGSSALKSRGVRSALRDALVVVEVALAFILLAGAGLLLRTLLNLQHTDTGLNAENVLTVHMVVSGARESSMLAERVAQIPGVRAAGFISMLPLQNTGWSGGFTIPGRTDLGQAELRYVTPGYFRAMGIPIRRGRDFSSRDTPDVPRSILINEALARRYFQNEDPVGRTLDRGTIIGVAGDVRQSTLKLPAQPEIYYAVAQNFAQIRRLGSTLVVRGDGPPEALVAAIRAAVREVNPNQALFRVATMQRVIEESLASPKLYAWLLGLFGLLGALLAAAGIYSVVAYLVALRTREFGIRMALGADAGHLLRLVMSRGAVLAALGLAIGMGAASALTRVLQTLLYGVTATDPVTFGAMAMLLAAVTLAACLLPARRATQIDPMTALRHE